MTWLGHIFQLIGKILVGHSEWRKKTLNEELRKKIISSSKRMIEIGFTDEEILTIIDALKTPDWYVRPITTTGDKITINPTPWADPNEMFKIHPDQVVYTTASTNECKE